MSADYPIRIKIGVDGAEQTKAQVNGLTGALGNLDAGSATASKSTVSFSKSLSSAATSITGATTSATALIFQYTELNDRQLAIDRAALKLAKSEDTLIAAQDKLNKLTAAGITSGQDYENANRDLANAQETVRVNSETLADKQEDLSKAQIGFALQVVPTVISAVTAAASAHAALTTAHVATGTSAVGAAGGMRVLKGALDLLLGHPILLVLAGIATVLTLIITNTFGVRDALDAFAKKVEEVFPFLKPVFDFFRSIADVLAPKTQEAVAEMSTSVTTDFTTMATSATESATDISNAMTKIEKKSDDAADAVRKAYAAFKKILPSSANVIGEGIANPRANAVTETSGGIGGGSSVGPNIFNPNNSVGDAMLSDAVRRYNTGSSTTKLVITIDDEGRLLLKKAITNSNGSLDGLR